MPTDKEIQSVLEAGLGNADPMAALTQTNNYFREAQSIRPILWFLRANVAEHARDFETALQSLMHVASSDKPDPAHLYYCGQFLLNTGQPFGAAEVFKALYAASPANPDIAQSLAAAYLEAGAYDACIAHIEASISFLEPKTAQAQLLQAMCMVGAFEAVFEKLNGDGERYRTLILDLHSAGAFRQALAIVDKAVELWPSEASVWNYRGIVCTELDQIDDALEAYRKSLSLVADDQDVLCNLGAALATCGRFEEAKETFDKVLTINPANIRALRHVTDMTRLDETDPEVVQLERLAEVGGLPMYDRAAVLYALGKAYDDQKRYPEAVRCFVAGGNARSQISNLDVDDEVSLLARIGKIFPAGDLDRLYDDGEPAAKPVFVVGLPRSGTTLVEQILAGHPMISAGGELPHLRDAVLQHADGRKGSQSLPSWEFCSGPVELTATMLNDIARDYLEAINEIAPEARHLVDKQPLNDRYLGFAALAFPNATIIHCVRDLADTSVSCVSKNFEADVAFTNTLEGMGLYARAQRQLMAMWETLFPGRILTVRYEDLVQDPEPQARRLVAAMNLDWSDKCLQLAGSDRIVKTASVQQVRNDIYQTSVGRWQRYMPEIQPLIDALGRGETWSG